MIVLDANILIRAVLGRHVRQLLETYAGHGIRFYAPDVAYADASKYLPSLLRKKGVGVEPNRAKRVHLSCWALYRVWRSR
jgi:predicted nucleic acid-binding protein